MLFYFLLLTPPQAPTCALWLDRPPIVRDYYAPTCPLDLMLPWDYYDLRLIGGDGNVLCTWAAATSLVNIPCDPSPANNYRIEVWVNLLEGLCTLKAPALTADAIATQCPGQLEQYRDGELIVWGPYEIPQPPPPEPVCVLPQVDNRSDLATHHRYEFLQGRLTWYGLHWTEDEWQNQWDNNILGAADAASVPATTLKSIMGLETRFWPAWTGDQGEVGLIQLTDDGADNALRWSVDLFKRYCPLAVFPGPGRCRSYDLLTAWERGKVRAALLADLTLQGWPTETAAEVKTDLWAYAHVLAATYCQVQSITDAPLTWDTVAAVYHAGGTCLQADGSLCPEGVTYLEQLRQ